MLKSPGIEVKEVEFSQIVGSHSSTSVGIVGGATKGPLSLTKITSQRQLHQIFGRDSKKDFAIKAAEVVLTESNEVWFQRVVHRGNRAACVDSTSRLKFRAREGGTFLNGAEIAISKVDEETYKISLVKDNLVLEEIFVSTNAVNPDYIYSKFNDTSRYLWLDMEPGYTFKDEVLSLSGGTAGAKFATAGHPGSDKILFTSREYDSTLGKVSIRIAKSKDPDFFDINVEKDGEVIESVKRLSTDPNHPDYFVTKYNRFSTIFTVEDDIAKPLRYKILQVTGGDDGIDGLTADDIIGFDNDGLQAFSNPDNVDISVLIIPGWSDPRVINAGIKLAEERGEVIYLPDIPRGLSPKLCNDWANGTGAFASENKRLDSSYFALYAPWVGTQDPDTGEEELFPPSMFIAAQYAKSDNLSDPWFAPAGIKRGQISLATSVEYDLSKDERDSLYGETNIINPIINFKGRGIVIWGNKTGRRGVNDNKESVLSSVNVRRLLNYLKKVVTASSQYLTFDQNDEYTWNEWHLMIDPILRAVKTRRGLYDYKLVMDETTVTPDDVDNLRMPGKIYIKPTRSSEFIYLDFIITPSGATFGD